MRALMLWLLMIGLASCGSSKKEERELVEREHEDIQREYVVRDSSSPVRPGWIEDAELWAKNHGKDMERYRYFSYETGPKVSRSISCNLAKANVRANIAGEISSFINKTLAESQEGAASVNENDPHLQALKEYVENTLAEKIQASVHGAAVVKTYWEKREYQEDLGAKRDFKAYTCAVFIRMDAKRLQDSIDRAASLVLERADDSETKSNVKQALQEVSQNFVKSKRGEN